MSLDLVVAEDHPGLRNFIGDRAQKRGLGKKVAVASTYKEARLLIEREVPMRVISDNIFEGEPGRGLDLLDRARTLNPQAQLHLLTGQPLSQGDYEFAKRRSIRIVKKERVAEDLIDNLILGITAEMPIPPTTSPDIAMLVMENASLREKERQAKEGRLRVNALAESLIQDIYQELTSYEEGIPLVAIGGRTLTRDQLRDEIAEKTEVGMQIIQNHADLNRMLRGGRK